MKKKTKSIVKKGYSKNKKQIVKKKMNTTGQKFIVGEDEFCPSCMEWRSYDEKTGKCMICGCQIKKKETKSRIINEEYDLKDFTVEHDEQQDNTEF